MKTPVMNSWPIPPDRTIDGSGWISLLWIRFTSETESTINPVSLPSHQEVAIEITQQCLTMPLKPLR